LRPKSIYVVYARWCPHCVPVTVDPLSGRAEELGIPIVLLDIDTDDVQAADDMVRKYGDWTDDYLVPQVFFEYGQGRIEHVLTGDPRGVALTRKAVESLLASEPLAVKNGARAGSK